MPVDAKLFENLSRLIKKHPKNSEEDWFVMGYIYAHPNNIKTLEEVFTAVNNITQLARDDSLSIEESHDVLLRMMNNLSSSERNKNRMVQKESEPRESKSSERGVKKVEEVSIKKAALPSVKNGTGKNVTIEDDMSYKSDSDSDSNRIETSKKNPRTINNLPRIEEEIDENSYKKMFGKGGSQNSNSQITYVKKPVDQIDTSSVREPKNLKRPPQSDDDALSMELIRKIQEEDSRAELLRELEEKRKKEVKEEKEYTEGLCSICLGSLLDESFIPLEGCEHIFHENCFGEYLKSEIQARHFPINCPSNCGQEVSQSDMVQVLDKDLVTKFYEYSLQKYVSSHGDDISCCPTPSCTYAFVKEEGDEDNTLNCPLCRKKYCLACRTEYHKGLTCKEYQTVKKRETAAAKFEEFERGKKFKQCPKCKHWVEKIEGYDHMTCVCKNQFCYKCGGKYKHCECIKKMQEEIQRKQELARQKQQEMKNRKKRH